MNLPGSPGGVRDGLGVLADVLPHLVDQLRRRRRIRLPVDPGHLESHPDHKVAVKQMKHPGAMMSFELKNGKQAGIDFMNKLKMCIRTVSLGTAETILCHPASMTHYAIPKEEKEKYGITDGLIRLSVGLENVQDILNDFDQALR